MFRKISSLIFLFIFSACVVSAGETATNQTPTHTRSIQTSPTPLPFPAATFTSIANPELTSAFEPTPTQEPASIKVDEEDPYVIEITGYSNEQLKAISVEELIGLAPILEAEKYCIEDEGITGDLKPSEVIRVREEGTNSYDQPYVIYTDEEGEVRAGLDLKEGAIEYTNLSEYTHEETGLKIRSFIITEDSMRRQAGRSFELDEVHEGDVSRVLAEWTIPLNNMVTNHEEEFSKMVVGMRDMREMFWKISFLSDTQREAIKARARKLLEEDMNKLDIPEDNEEFISELEIDLPMGSKLELDKSKEIQAIFRYVYSSNYAERDITYPPFRFEAFIEISDSPSGRMELNINMDRNYLNHFSKAHVGGDMAVVLMSITAGGLGWNRNFPVDGDDSFEESLGNDIVPSVCSEGVIDSYLQSIGKDWLENYSIPFIDTQSAYVPKCLIKEVGR